MRYWTVKEVTTAHELQSRGHDIAAIAMFIGRTALAVKKKLDEMAEPFDRPPQRDCGAPKKRPCLKCRMPFRSAGFHNRLCNGCGDVVANMSYSLE